MAKKSVKQKTPPLKSFILFIIDDKTKLVTGLLLIVLSIITTIAFISYLFTWKSDYSFQWESVVSPPEVRVDNFGGKFGAYISQLFISNAFGVVSFFIPFLLFIGGLNLLKLKRIKFWRTFRIIAFLAIFSSILISLIFHNVSHFLGNGPGGRHGLQMSLWLESFIGKPGAYLFTLLGLFSVVVFSFDKPLDLLRNLFIPKNTPDKEFDSPKKSFSDTFNPPRETSTSTCAEVDSTDDDLTFETEFTKAEEESIFEVKSVNNTNVSNDEGFTEDMVENQTQQQTNKELDIEIQNRVHEAEVKHNTTQLENYDPTLELSHYKFPDIDLLENHQSENTSVSQEELISNKNKIVDTLANYKIQIDKIKATIGPTITLYEIVPAPGVRISKIKNLEDDIALNLSALGIRIIAPIPGKGTVGIEVPNQHPEIVSMRSLVASKRFQESKYQLAVALGKTISNETHVFDLCKMPHLLVAGATGQGKSVGLNVILTSLLYKKHPAQLKFVLVDPKKVELTLYSKIEKHFLAKLPDSEEAIVTDTQKVIYTLQSLCVEMDARYDLLKIAQVRNIAEYNDKFIKRRLNPENGHRYMPYIVVVIDEFADLIMTAGKEVEAPLARLAQLARAIGIHLIIATQRPTTNIITGMIKANFPARIAFRVTSMMDSRTILDSPGANQLVGRGDMLFAPGSDLIRIQCGFVDIPELERITSHIEDQQSYTSALMLPEVETEDNNDITDVDLSKKDALFFDAARLVVMNQQGSTSLIQRKFSIGYNRAGRIIDQLEAAGIVGPFEGSKARQVLFPDDYALEQYLNQLS